MEDYLERLIMSNNKISPHLIETTYIEMCHGVTVSNLVRAVAVELGADQDFCDKIAVAGLLHDVGKLRLAKYLNSEDRETLTVEKMKYVRMHPTHSYNALCRAGYSEDIARAVYFHHENFDGTGYPDKLQGEQIPWMARILRTCDVFAALTSDRSYRRAFDWQTAMEIMIDEVADYDMQVFLAFQRQFHGEQFWKIRMDLTPLQKWHLGLFIAEAEAAD